MFIIDTGIFFFWRKDNSVQDFLYLEPVDLSVGWHIALNNHESGCCLERTPQPQKKPK